MKTTIVYEYYGHFVNMWAIRKITYDMNMKDALRRFWHHSLITGERRIDYKNDYKIVSAEETK